MKNEVKKKMMIDRRKSWHQSHGERTSWAKVNKIFWNCIESRLLFILNARPVRVETARAVRWIGVREPQRG